MVEKVRGAFFRGVGLYIEAFLGVFSLNWLRTRRKYILLRDMYKIMSLGRDENFVQGARKESLNEKERV